MPLTLDDVKRSYVVIAEDIKKNVKRRNYNKAFSLIDTYALLIQSINDHFYDEVIETALKDIATDGIGVRSMASPLEGKRIIFYDQIGTTICLGLQYLRALSKLGYDIVYLFESPLRDPKPALLDEVKGICSSIHIFSGKSKLNTAKKIQGLIVNSGASKILTHFSAEGALAASVLYSITGIDKFRIVPGDHHFNIGVDCYDHFFEYRRFAIKVAHEERGIPLKKIYKLPYYPIITSFCDFQGFPQEAENKVKILAAGSEYKFHGSNWFFDTCDWILKNHENVVILFLGGKSSQIEHFVSEKGLEGKFILAGYRKDFVECMKRVDMFLNSFPMGGGLVGLTAINLGVPVISHFDETNALQNSIRSFLGAEDIDSPISFEDDDKLKVYVTKLINDSTFRKKEGSRMKEMAQTEERFTQMLGQYLEGELPSVNEVTNISCHLDNRVNSYIQLQNDFLPTFLHGLLSQYGLFFLNKFPHLKGFAAQHRKLIIGWWLGIVANSLLPPHYIEKLKKIFKKLFV